MKQKVAYNFPHPGKITINKLRPNSLPNIFLVIAITPCKTYVFE